MKFIKRVLLVCLSIFCLGCESNEEEPECTKTITIPQFYIIGNQTYSYDIEQEVACDLPDPVDAVEIEPPLLENFSYEVLSFVYTPDTGNNTSRLEFEIQLNNLNDFDATGVPILTIDFDGIQVTGSYSNNASIPCYQIESNSNCILTYSVEESLDLGMANSVQLLDVKYYLTN